MTEVGSGGYPIVDGEIYARDTRTAYVIVRRCPLCGWEHAHGGPPDLAVGDALLRCSNCNYMHKNGRRTACRASSYWVRDRERLGEAGGVSVSLPAETAAAYIARGWSPLPIPFREKGPVVDDWPALRITAETVSQHFNGSALNIGVLLGEPSGGLVDADLDCAETCRLAPGFLSSKAVFGRASKPQSHYLFVSALPPKTLKFKDPESHGVPLPERSMSDQSVTYL